MERLTDEQILDARVNEGSLDELRGIAQAQLEQDQKDCASCREQIKAELESLFKNFWMHRISYLKEMWDFYWGGVK